MKPIYHLNHISRTLSSGYESSTKKSFETLEEAATYIHDVWYDEFCEAFEFPSDWDEEDMGGPFPSKEEFTIKSIMTKMKNKQTVNLFRYYSQYAALIPNELILEKY